MIDRKYRIIYRIWDAEFGPYGLLAVTVFTVFVASPLVVIGVLDPLFVDAFFAVFMFAGVLTVHPRPVLRYLVLVLAAIAVLIRFSSRFFPGDLITISQAVIEVAAIGLFAALVMKQFLVSERPPSHRICAAVMVYLFLGVLWARLFEITGLMIPGAFHMEDGSTTLTTYLYFSFVTLATVGYGDMSPVHPVARNLAILEAITGQMYLAILIARLVSMTSNGKKS